MEQPAPKINATQSRQGATGHQVRYVLIAGLVLAVIAFVVFIAFVH